MACLYHLKYGRDGEQRELDVCPVLYGKPITKPENHRYFYGVQNGVRICFIKRCGENQRRHHIEAEAARISSPYVAAYYRNPLMHHGTLEYYDRDTWRELSGDILIYEYLPYDLEGFRKECTEKYGEISETCRRQILLKLMQGVAHVHQARIIHRDIKPTNILINCSGLCDEVPWNHKEEPDVKLMDFDAAHDGRYTTPEVFTASAPFQPNRSMTPSVWLDLYSLCMVILWLYDSIDGYLHQINFELPKTPERIKEIMSEHDAQIPPALSQILLPFLAESIQKMEVGEFDESRWEDGASWLSSLYQKLSAAFREDSDWCPMELLRAGQESPVWSAIVQIDRESWPVLGQGMEYRMLSVVDRLPDPHLRGQPVDRHHNGTAVIPYYSGAVMGKSPAPGPVHAFSAPPEIFLAGEQSGGVWSLKAGIFGSQKRADGPGYEKRRLGQKDHIPENTDTELFNGPPVCVRQNKNVFFQNVHVHSVHFYGTGEGPELLPVFSGQAQNTDANINLVFVMPRPEKSEKDNYLGCRLIRQVVEWISPLEECRPCYYGVTMSDKFPTGQSFCGGRLNPSPQELSQQYSTSLNTRYRQDRKWSHQRRTEDRYSFDPGRPTIVIGFWDRPLDWLKDPVQYFKNTVKELHPSLNRAYAVEYLQLFTTDQATGIQELAPHLAAAVRPDGACVLTPILKEGEFPDPGGRWLTAALRWCQR